MTLPRSALINPAATPYYHCVSRCVRRAFLCGQDDRTGYNFEHRRAWIEKRLHELADTFAINLCAYAVMSNHYHVVLHLDTTELSSWSDDEVISRWKRIHNVPAGFETADALLFARFVNTWRERLGSISWFMKCVNEPLARLANHEDGCKGRFWEGRFKSQALLDENAIIQCMAYVDLNPIRAKKAKTPETSNYTSIQARIEQRAASLAPLAGQKNANHIIPINLQDYLLLVDGTGRALQRGKRGRIDAGLTSILERLRFSQSSTWLQDMSNLTRRYCRAIGSTISLRNYREYLGQARLNGVTG